MTEPYQITKCPCGHPACNQYTIEGQRTVGFDIEQARVLSAAPVAIAALEALEEGSPECQELMRRALAVARGEDQEEEG